MKICPKCKTNESLAYHSYCLECSRIRMLAYSQQNKDRVSQNANRRREKLKAICKDAKNKPCCDCGESHPHFVMDFDHVRGKKDFGIAGIGTFLPSENRLLLEIAKCDVVCANCHRKRTANRTPWLCGV